VLVKRATTLSLLCLLLCSNITFAMDSHKSIVQYVHDIFIAEQGLPQNTVISVVQTPDGYIWAATQEGLARFDGVQFTIFDSHNTPELKSGLMAQMAVGRDGSLWITKTDGGITQFKNGRFTTYMAQDGLAGNDTMCSVEDNQGNIWIGTSQKGLSRFKDGQFTTFTTRDGLANDNVWVTGLGPDGSLWLGTAKGLSHFKDGKFTNYGIADGLTSDYIQAVYTDKKGNLWVGTTKGLHLFKDEKFTRFNLGEVTDEEEVVDAILEDADANFWVGTSHGLYRFKDGKSDAYKRENGLSGGVQSLCEDREGNLWLGTIGGGLHKLSDGKFTAYTVKEGLSRDPIWTVYGDRAGNLWAGVSRGGLNLLKDGKFTPYEPAKTIADKSIYAMCEDRAGNLWVASRGGQLNQFKDGKMTSYRVSENEYNNDIAALAEDQAGTLWAGTRRQGLKRFVNGQFINQEGFRSAVTSVFCLVPSRDGGLWIGTNVGLYHLMNGKMEFQEGLSTEYIYSVYEDPQGSLWIGTHGGGLNRLKNGKISVYTMKDGLFDDVAFQILEDGDNFLWMSGNKGVYSVNKQQLDDFDKGTITTIASASYSTADGMASRECNGGNQPSGCKAADGSLWFPTIRGVVRLNAAKLNIQAPPVHVEQVTVDQKSLAIGATVEAPPGKGNLQFRYTALSYVNPAKVKFKVKLEGYDEDWVDVGTRREAFYTNLAPGPYRFLVMACNNDGVWSQTGASLNLYLKPFFYQSRWFYLACTLLLIGAAFAGYRLRVGHLETREKELQQLVTVRTSQLEAANQKLYELAILDEMTGVANHRRFKEVLDMEWKRAARQSSMISLALIDIDYFKNYNDTYGHQAGDECLRQVATAMRETISRPTDLVARYGGEEFGVILTDTDEEGAAAVAETIRKAIESLMIPHAGSLVSDCVTISVGVATLIPHPDGLAKEIIKGADQSLYEAKHRGRNQIACCTLSCLVRTGSASDRVTNITLSEPGALAHR
jgi:diguanylate cyclase (GGDEF)-like protein